MIEIIRVHTGMNDPTADSINKCARRMVEAYLNTGHVIQKSAMWGSAKVSSIGDGLYKVDFSMSISDGEPIIIIV